jgi:glucose/arabinose dehydrogenase
MADGIRWMREGVCRGTVAFAAAALLLLVAPIAAQGATREQIGVFDTPVYITSDPQDADRLLVAERRGVILEVRGAERTVWADLQDRVLCCDGDRGLLSIAPAPDFHTSDRIYVAYTGVEMPGGEAGDIYVEGFRHVGGALVREPLLDIPHAADPHQNGGQLNFGPDGGLWAAFGDGGGVGDPFDDAQNVETLLGKLIRVFPNPGQAVPYVVPADNPFVGEAAKDEIWSYGLRDPRRFSFDRLTGDLVIPDTGQDSREEINFAPRLAGALGARRANFGWDCREGLIDYAGESSPACLEPSPFTDPVFDYPHTEGCSIRGGYVVRDDSVPELYGRYLYGDFCTGAVRSIELSAASPAATDRAEPALGVASGTLNSFGEDSCGRTYVVTRNGPVYRIVGSRPAVCRVLSNVGPIRRARTRRTVVKLNVWRGPRGKVRIKARVKPCAENRGRRLILKQDGKRFGSKRVRGRCLAKFATRVTDRATFRALLRRGRGGTVRSRRVVVRPQGD